MKDTVALFIALLGIAYLIQILVSAIRGTKRYCITCHKVTRQHDNEFIGWICRECNESNWTRSQFKELKNEPE